MEEAFRSPQRVIEAWYLCKEVICCEGQDGVEVEFFAITGVLRLSL